MSDLAFTLIVATVLIVGTGIMLAIVFHRSVRRSRVGVQSHPEPLALGKPIQFIGARADGKPTWFVPTEFTWNNGETHIVFQDQKSYEAARRLR